jgi:hypothetical protein
MLRSFYSRGRAPVPIELEAGRFAEPVRTREEYLSLPEIENPALRPVTIHFTELFRITGRTEETVKCLCPG